ncbi:hypothetical protein [Paenibacillus shenyangensis]|uniref:hypothetical protein n=1 Tax=Paenibacillus sp. A9 TaxID=1284352 RepID=UPI000365A98A|nr:hypothetical protein [Paenibacillus sp. A9]
MSGLSISRKLKNYIDDNNLSISAFGDLCNVNRGILSAVINGSKVISPDQLDKVTAAMQLNEGSLYSQYIEEYLETTAPDWRRIKRFLVRSAETDQLECVEQVVNLVSDDLLYSELLFELAEELLKSDLKEAAIILYENVAINEKRQHSERLALCRYRLFVVKQGNDQEENYRLAITFEEYVDKLDTLDQLDALRDLANVYRSMRKWDRVERIALQLREKAAFQYQLQPKLSDHQLMRPLFVYISYSYLLLGGAYEYKKDYSKALRYLNQSGDVSWVREEDEEAQIWKERFQNWAVVNSYVPRLLSGEEEVLNDYSEYIDEHKDELSMFLLNAAEAANQYGFNIDHILEKYRDELAEIEQSSQNIKVYTEQISLERYSSLSYELAEYYFSKGNYELGYSRLLISLKQSYILNDKKYIIKNVGLFEKVRQQASTEVMENYQNMINEVYRNEK